MAIEVKQRKKKSRHNKGNVFSYKLVSMPVIFLVTCLALGLGTVKAYGMSSGINGLTGIQSKLKADTSERSSFYGAWFGRVFNTEKQLATCVLYLESGATADEVLVHIQIIAAKHIGLSQSGGHFKGVFYKKDRNETVIRIDYQMFDKKGRNSIPTDFVLSLYDSEILGKKIGGSFDIGDGTMEDFLKHTGGRSLDDFLIYGWMLDYRDDVDDIAMVRKHFGIQDVIPDGRGNTLSGTIQTASIKKGTYLHDTKDMEFFTKYKIAILSVDGNIVTFKFESIDRPMCDISFEGELKRESDTLYSFDDPSYPLSFKLTALDNRLVISDVNADRSEECSVWVPDVAFTIQ